MPRNTRSTTAQSVDGKENQSQRDNVSTPTGKKARHRLSTTELARLEDVFKQETHPSRQQKKDLAAQLGMDYKTITIWFQNKRQTMKRGQLSAEKSERNWRRARSDSCLRTVSSPSHNATLGACEVVPTASPLHIKSDSITSKAIVKIKPLLDSLNALTSRPREHSTDTRNEATDVEDVDRYETLTLLESDPTEANRHDRAAEQEQIKDNIKTPRWKRIRTLEWACERQTKRRKLSREGYVRLGSEEAQGDDTNDARMDSALSLLSLASSAQVDPPRDVMRESILRLHPDDDPFSTYHLRSGSFGKE